jgi:hypothetical protein
MARGTRLKALNSELWLKLSPYKGHQLKMHLGGTARHYGYDLATSESEGLIRCMLDVSADVGTIRCQLALPSALLFCHNSFEASDATSTYVVQPN